MKAAWFFFQIRVMRRLFGLRRFRWAQDEVYSEVVSELLIGRKKSHWMWFVFPQAEGLGTSFNSRYYGLSQQEARAYLCDHILRGRLHECVWLVIAGLRSGRSLDLIFGSLDAQKYRSSMELFWNVSHDPVFMEHVKYEGRFAGQEQTTRR